MAIMARQKMWWWCCACDLFMERGEVDGEKGLGRGREGRGERVGVDRDYSGKIRS